MDKYECGINGYVYDPASGCDGSPGASRPCDFVYDPAKGDPDNGIAPGTAFEDLPEDWICPVCDEPKCEFRKET